MLLLTLIALVTAGFHLLTLKKQTNTSHLTNSLKLPTIMFCAQFWLHPLTHPNSEAA